MSRLIRSCRFLIFTGLLALSPQVSSAQFDDLELPFGPGQGLPGGQQGFHDIVSTVSASVEPKEAKRGEIVTLKMKVNVTAPGWHTYPTVQKDQSSITRGSVNRFKLVEHPVIEWKGKLKEPKPGEKKLETGETMQYYEGEVEWEQQFQVKQDAKPGKITVEVKGNILVCNESGCLPPELVPMSAELTVLDADAPVQEEVAEESEDAEEEAEPVAGEAGGDDGSSGLMAFLLTGVFWGAVSLVTPCVFPMIPITVTYFLKQSESKHHKPLITALVYTGTIVTVLTVGAILLLGFFSSLGQHWAMNLALGVLFMVFAFSLFGMFEIRLPGGLARLTSSQEGKGGYLGTMFMALTFTIISFTCVAPFLGGFAGLSVKERPIWEIILGGLSFSLTFALPFFLLALFPSLLKTLPKSGSWLNSVKVVMGFLELAAGLKFLRASELVFFNGANFLTYDFVMGMYVAISLACGLYLLNVFRMSHDSPAEHLTGLRLLFSLAFLCLGFYLAPSLLNQRPAGTVFAWIDSFVLPDSEKIAAFARAQGGGGGGGGESHELGWGGNLQKGLKTAKDQGKLVFIDFTGET